MPSHPRPAVKAIIIENDCLLALEMRDDNGIYYKLPGGGQDAFETMPEALQRECAEETNLQVAVDKLLWIADHIFQRPHPVKSANSHQTEAFFRCYITGTAPSEHATIPDTDQIGIAWLPLDQLPQLRLYPLLLREKIGQLPNETGTAIYLGKIE